MGDERIFLDILVSRRGNALVNFVFYKLTDLLSIPYSQISSSSQLI